MSCEKYDMFNFIVNRKLKLLRNFTTTSGKTETTILKLGLVIQNRKGRTI